MRILIALTYYRPHYSGLTIYAERLARALAARGHQVTILTSRFDKSLKSREIVDGVEVVRPRVWFHVSKGVIMPSLLLRAWQILRRVDVVNLHVPQLDAAGIAILSRILDKPVVMTYHCDLYLPKSLINLLANLASDIANHITAQAANVIVQNSQDYAENSSFLEQYINKVMMVYPPVELNPVQASTIDAFRRKYAIEPGQRIIGMAARVATEKGVEYLAQALPVILERFPQARVLHVGPYQDVIGEEAYRQRVMQLIEPMRDRWTWLGVVPDDEMSAFFHTCEVLALPSLNSTESFGIVQVEAMICGAPVVVSNLPGMRVPVQQTGKGIIIPPADGLALARAIIQILDRPLDYQGNAGPLVQQSIPAAVAEAYEQIFKSLLG